MKTCRPETMIGMPVSESRMSLKRPTTCAILGDITILRASLSRSASPATVAVGEVLMIVTARGTLSIESMKWMSLGAPQSSSVFNRSRRNVRRSQMVS